MEAGCAHRPLLMKRFIPGRNRRCRLVDDLAAVIALDAGAGQFRIQLNDEPHSVDVLRNRSLQAQSDFEGGKGSAGTWIRPLSVKRFQPPCAGGDLSYATVSPNIGPYAAREHRNL